MSLKAVVAVLGGDLYAQGTRANVPAPGHSASDRSVSLLLSRGRILVHSFGGASWRDVLDDLRRRGLVDSAGAPAGAGVRRFSPEPSAPERVATARALWDEAGPVRSFTLPASYGRRRCVERDLELIEALRSHPALPISVFRPNSQRRPGLIAAVSDNSGELTAVEITYLAPNGERSRDLKLSRKTVGRLPAGSAVRLDAPDAALLVAEGVFSALSAGERFQLPAWALLSTSNLRRWTPPDGVREVLIAGDRGQDGERSAVLLQTALRQRGLRAAVRLPPPPYGDWNDAARSREEGRAGAPGFGGVVLPTGRSAAGDPSNSNPRAARPERAHPQDLPAV